MALIEFAGNADPTGLMSGPQATIISAEAKFLSSSFKGYYMFSKTEMMDDVFSHTIKILGKVDDNTNMFKLIKGLEEQAIMNGAKQISIKGTDILNPDLLNIKPEMAERLGYTLSRTGDDSIELIKTLEKVD